MSTIFKDPAHQETFEREGYVQLDLLNENELANLLDVYERFLGQPKEGDGRAHLYESSRTHSLEWNINLNNALRDGFEAPIARFFCDYNLFGGTFMLKVPVNSSILPLHQDWSIVQEDKYVSAFIWCPLVDITPENGGLFVIPRSHRFFNNFRSGSMQSQRIMPEGVIKEHVVDIRLKAGQALAYYDRLFHGSYQNHTDQQRIVATARVNEKAADLVYYHQVSENEVDIIKATPEFYLKDASNLDKGIRPEGFQTLETIPYTYEPVTDEMLAAKLS